MKYNSTIIVVGALLSWTLVSCKSTSSQSDALIVAKRGGTQFVVGKEGLALNETYKVSADALKAYQDADRSGVQSQRLLFGDSVIVVDLGHGNGDSDKNKLVRVKVELSQQLASDGIYWVGARYLESTNARMFDANPARVSGSRSANFPETDFVDYRDLRKDAPVGDDWVYEVSEDVAKNLNSNNGRYTLERKKPGGSSRQLWVKEGDKIVGIFSPPMHATWLLGEIFTYNLGRIFDRPLWVAPAVRMTLKGEAAQTVDRLYSESKWQYLDKGASKSRRADCNQKMVRSYFRKGNKYIHGVFIPFDSRKPEGFPKLVNPVREIYDLNYEHFLVKTLTGQDKNFAGDVYYDEASTDVVEYQTEFKTSRRDAIAQTSLYLVLDVLVGQRDRLNSGGNVEVFVDKSKGEFYIAPIDNGGIGQWNACPGCKALYNVTTFEQNTLDTITNIMTILNGGEAQILGKTVDKIGLQKMLGYERLAGDNNERPEACSRQVFAPLFDEMDKRWGAIWPQFEKMVRKVDGHIKNLWDQGKLTVVP